MHFGKHWEQDQYKYYIQDIKANAQAIYTEHISHHFWRFSMIESLREHHCVFESRNNSSSARSWIPFTLIAPQISLLGKSTVPCDVSSQQMDDTS